MILRLDHIPDAYLKIGVPPGATVYRWPPEYGAVPWAGATVYVQKEFEVPRALGCAARNLVDEIDLSAIRRNGFHLLEARASTDSPPKGFGMGASQSGSAFVELVGSRDEPGAIIRNTEKIRIRAVAWQKDDDQSAFVQCVSAYRMRIVLRGPGKKDPLDGFR